MDKSKKWPVSPNLQDNAGSLSEASYNDWLAWGYAEGPRQNVLVDRTDSLIVFLYRGHWHCLGTNGLGG